MKVNISTNETKPAWVEVATMEDGKVCCSSMSCLHIPEIECCNCIFKLIAYDENECKQRIRLTLDQCEARNIIRYEENK